MEENCEQEDEKVILQNGRLLVFHICSMIGMSGVLIPPWMFRAYLSSLWTRFLYTGPILGVFSGNFSLFIHYYPIMRNYFEVDAVSNEKNQQANKREQMHTEEED